MTPEQYARARQLLSKADDAYRISSEMDCDDTNRAMLDTLEIILAALKPEPVGPRAVAEELGQR